MADCESCFNYHKPLECIDCISGSNFERIDDDLWEKAISNMKMEVKKVVKKEVEETVEVELKKYWVVRIVQGVTCKKRVDEKEFKHIPTEKEIAECLLPYYGKSCFATVEENYRLVS